MNSTELLNSTLRGAAAICGSSSTIATSGPGSPANPPGLSAIKYRIGTFTSFRRAMLNKVASPDLMLGAENPFLRWHEGIDGDYQTMLIELWAYLADILTFYQERIANEAFVTTATQLDSLLRLVTLINYRPSPGSAASGLVAFNVAKGPSVIVPAGSRVGSRAQSGKPATVFETSTALAGFADNSAIPLSLVSPTVDFQENTVVLQGLNNRIAAGDFLLAVENEGSDSEAANLRQVTAVSSDKTAGTTTLSWQDPIGPGSFASKSVAVYAFRTRGAPFGSTAPDYKTLSLTLTTGLTFSPPILTPSGRPLPDPPFPYNWDDPGNLWSFIPSPDDDPSTIYLDAPITGVRQNPQTSNWAVLFNDGGNNFQVVLVTDTREVTKVGYAISAKVTRLMTEESIERKTFPLRSTLILAGSERLTLQEALPLPDTLSGKTLVLMGIHTELHAGQTIILQGNLSSTASGPPSATLAAESGILDGRAIFDLSHNLTTVTLKDPLARAYVRASCSLMANVAEVTQGETVRDEILGSGDGTAFQSYQLKKSPLTYEPSTDPESVVAVQSTLLVTVNGSRWLEQPSLVDNAPHDQVFTTTSDAAAQTSVLFGDGINGARPPSGINNIRARYRKGLGASGNLPSGAIQQLLDSVTGLQRVTNPIPLSGGGDADNVVQIRERAPASLRTFGRAVSVTDYAALALSFPGIAKAGATWVIIDPVTMRAASHPYVQLTLATVDGFPTRGTVFAGKLRRFLDDHRDPNVALRVQDFSPVFVDIAVNVHIDDDSPHRATLERVRAALNPGPNPDGSLGFFAFERLAFGQSIFLSAIYAVVQAVQGVSDAAITTLRRSGPPPADAPSVAPHDIVIGPTEIAIVNANDPAEGSLNISGQGGFSDT
jgi:predicted phage baseplate assembly protein